MTKIASVSLADKVFETLENDILSGKYARGDIVTELKLSSEMNVSRTPVREALRRLQQENLVSESGKGAEIIGIDVNDLADIYEIRKSVEGKASAKCAAIITDEQLSELEKVLELQEFYTQKSSTDGIKETDSSFHELIYKFCGSVIYCNTLTLLHRKAQKFRKLSVEDPDRAVKATAEHKKILEALKNHNASLAEKLSIEHIENAERSIMYSLKKI